MCHRGKFAKAVNAMANEMYSVNNATKRVVANPIDPGLDVESRGEKPVAPS
jgi:hypothetical protein